VRVNIAKLLLLAALAPASSVGIAQRSTALVGAEHAGSWVPVIGTLGSVSAILGTLALGWIADGGPADTRRRWTVVLSGAIAGIVGLVCMAIAPRLWMLAVGWMIAQFGCSGAMASTRALLAQALPKQRRRGATAMVVLSYLGVFIPSLILLALPGAIWISSIGFALLAAALPAFILRPHERPRSGPDVTAEGAVRATVAGSRPDPTADSPRLLSWPMILAIAFLSNISETVYFVYHPLDIAARLGGAWTDATTRISTLVLVASLLGLLLTAAWFLCAPAILAHPKALIVSAGILLGVSTAGRGVVDSIPAIVVLSLIHGAGTAACTTALFTTALDRAPVLRAGRSLGIYSAAGALGTLLGPLAGLAVLHATSASGDYRPLFLATALGPLLWVALVLVAMLRRPEGSGVGWRRRPGSTPGR